MNVDTDLVVGVRKPQVPRGLAMARHAPTTYPPGWSIAEMSVYEEMPGYQSEWW